MTRDVEFPNDEHGLQACQLCGGSVVGRPFVLVRDLVACDGGIGHTVHRWEPREDEEEMDESDHESSHYVGPVLHVEACLADWAWGLCAEVPTRMREEGIA